jgi:hypothetical protein
MVLPAMPPSMPMPMMPPPPPEPDLSWLYPEEDDEDLALGYLDDDDYIEATKPSVSEATELAESLHADHALRIGQSREMCEAYDGDRPGYFKEDEEDILNDVIETMPLTTLRQMYDFRCGFIAMHEPYARLMNRDAIERDEAMAVEELVHYDFRCEERQFATQWGADLRLTEAAHLQRYGMLVGLDILDPKDAYCGLAMSLIDPGTVYPVFAGAGGLQEVVRIYEDEAPNIAGNYGGKPGTPENAGIASKIKSLTGMKRRDISTSPLNRHKVTEVWNRDWVTVIVDDEIEVHAYKHGYRRVPFTIVVGSFDLPAAASAGYGREGEMLTTSYGEVLINDSSIDIARRYRPYDWKKLRTHKIAEAVAGRQLTTLKWAINPHKVLEKDPQMGRNQEPLGPLRPGETTTVLMPNKMSLVTPIVDPQAMAGVNMALAANAQAGILGQLASGTVPPQTSGSALNGLIELGGAADVALVRLIQLFKRLRAQWRLELRRDFGGMLGKQGDLGVISVPNTSRSSDTPLYRVKPDMIRRTGCDVEVDLHNFRPDVTVAQYLSTLRTPSAVTGMPLISDETARRKLKAVPDPDREAERIEDEQLMAMPTIARLRRLRRLEREKQMALDEGDDETVDDAQAAILQLQFLQEADVMSGQAPMTPEMAPGGGGGGQQFAMPPPGNATPQLPGTSLPEQGIGVGTEGGRPPGSTGPPGGTAQAMTPVGGGSGY